MAAAMGMHKTKEHFKSCQGTYSSYLRGVGGDTPGRPVLGKVKQVVMTVILRDKRHLLTEAEIFPV